MAEDRRIALAALAVTAVVGLAAPIGTVLATNAHDDHRVHNEQVQRDRTELRRVLDDAVTALNIMRSRIDSFQVDRPPEEVVTLNTHLNRLQLSYSRVAIRLGRRSPAAKQMKRALDAALDAMVELSIVAERIQAPGHGPVTLEDKERNRFIRQVDVFIDVANEVGHSTTD